MDGMFDKHGRYIEQGALAADFYKPIGKLELMKLHTVIDGQLVPLPDGVHLLSQESQDIMKRIAERSAALEAGFTNKRGS